MSIHQLGDRTLAGDPENSICPGTPAFHYDSNNRPIFAHSTPIARKKIDVNMSCAESVIPTSTFVLPRCPSPPANSPAVKVSASQDKIQMSDSPSRRESHQGRLFSPAFAATPENVSRFSNRTLFTPVKMIVCTNSRTRQIANADCGSTRISQPRVVYDSRQQLRERNDRKIRHLVNSSTQATDGCGYSNVSVQTSFLETPAKNEGTMDTVGRLESTANEKVRREIELRAQLEDWCRRHYIIDQMMPVIFMVLYVVAFVSLFCPAKDFAELFIRLIRRM